MPHSDSRQVFQGTMCRQHKGIYSSPLQNLALPLSSKDMGFTGPSSPIEGDGGNRCGTCHTAQTGEYGHMVIVLSFWVVVTQEDHPCLFKEMDKGDFENFKGEHQRLEKI